MLRMPSTITLKFLFRKDSKGTTHALLSQLAYKVEEPTHRFGHNYDYLYAKFNLYPLKCIHRYNDLLIVYKI